MAPHTSPGAYRPLLVGGDCPLRSSPTRGDNYTSHRLAKEYHGMSHRPPKGTLGSEDPIPPQLIQIYNPSHLKGPWVTEYGLSVASRAVTLRAFTLVQGPTFWGNTPGGRGGQP